jgi:ABC-type polysaccharide/polyol phosphate export permease
MREIVGVVRRLLGVGGWAPLVVFAVHVIADQVFDAYGDRPRLDIPMHLAGGIAMAFFISGCFQAMPRGARRSSRVIVREALLVASLTTTAAVVWEFLEFAIDAATGTNIQVSLANTMQDLALGMAGAAVVVAARAWQTGAGPADLTAVAAEWMAG